MAVAGAAIGVPKQFTAGEPLKAADLNANFADIDARIDGVSERFTDWQPYSPVLVKPDGAPVANATTAGRYRRVGNALEVQVATQFSAPPQSSASWWAWTLPPGVTVDMTGATGATIVGGGMTGQGPNNNVALGVYVRSANTVSATGNGASSYYINDTQPFAWTNGGSLAIYFTVPIVEWASP